MNNYLIYCIDFTTTHYGNGIALVISDNCDTAIDILKTHGRLNGEPDEYRLLKQEVVGVSTITECTLVSEHYTGVTVIVGPKGKDGSEVPYSELQDLPSINGTTIVGNMLASQFNITTSQIINNSGYVVDNNYNHTDNNFTDILKNKLVDIPIPVQSDWNVTDISALGYIKNKPNIPAAQVQVDWNATTGITSILNKPILADVAISGDYNDLINIPESPDYISLRRIEPYLFEVTFDSLPEDNGNDNNITGGCSSYVQNGKLYRNLDFKYDEAASFIVKCKDFKGMSFITGLNDGNLDMDIIAQLPYQIVDGQNNYGIMVSTHILFNDWEWTGVGNKNIPLTRLPYLVMKNVKSMSTISQDLNGILNNLYAPDSLLAAEYLIQLLITDGTTTYALLPPTADNQSYVLTNITSNPKLTNFRWVSDTTVVRTNLQDRPTGVERWNMMPCDLKELRFTKAYETTDRLSEFIGIQGTTKDSTDTELTAIYNLAHTEYLNRIRNGVTWQTMHSIVYGNGIEELYIQENWNKNIIYNASKYRTIEEQNIIDNNFQSDINDINSALNDKQRKLIAGSNIILNEESTGVRITAISGTEGTFDHRDLINKDAAEQHPISAITNLQTTLNNKQNIINDIDEIRNNAELGATALQDAPSDNKQYARKNGTWIEVDKGDNTTDHRELEYKDAANQHPISAITGLQDALNGKQAAGNYATTQELDTLADIVDSKYVRPSSGIPESDLSSGVQSKLNFKEIFLCTYNTTTFQQVSDALDAGKLPVCIYSDRYYVYSGLSNGYHTFQCFITLNNIATYYRLYLKNSWGNANITMAQDSQCEKVDNKVTSWSTTPNDTHYPSEKLVKNSLNLKINEPSTEGTNGQVLTTDGNGGRSWTSVQGGESVRGIIDFPSFTSISPVYIGQSPFSPTAPYITDKYVYKLSSTRTGIQTTLTFAQGSTAVSKFEDYIVYIEIIGSSGFIIQFPNGWNKLGEISTASGNNNSYIIHFYPSCQLVKIEAYGSIH